MRPLCSKIFGVMSSLSMHIKMLMNVNTVSYLKPQVLNTNILKAFSLLWQKVYQYVLEITFSHKHMHFHLSFICLGSCLSPFSQRHAFNLGKIGIVGTGIQREMVDQ